MQADVSLMKFLPLLFANLRRRKIRTILTIGSFGVAMFLFGILGSIHYGFRQGIDIAGADRLVVIGRTSMMQPLPITYLPRLTRRPGRARRGARDMVRRRLPGCQELLSAVRHRARGLAAHVPEYVVDPAQWSAFPRRSAGVRHRRQAGAAVRVGGGQPDSAQGARIPRRRQLGFQRAGDLPRHPPG